jgi:hypothetical protein
MAAPCTMWARIVASGGVVSQVPDWKPSGSPSLGKGGFSFAGAVLPGTILNPVPLFLTVQGTGDSTVIINTQPSAVRVPPGFYPGWPGGVLDPATALGSADVLGDTEVTFPSAPGLVQTKGGVNAGRYYFEYEIFGYDIFSNLTGAGVARAGLNLAAWFNAGKFSVADANGGGQIVGGSIVNSFLAGFNANGAAGPNIGLAPQSTIVGVAVIVTPEFVPSLYNAQQLQPVPMVCLPCVELLIGPSGFGGFGR